MLRYHYFSLAVILSATSAHTIEHIAKVQSTIQRHQSLITISCVAAGTTVASYLIWKRYRAWKLPKKTDQPHTQPPLNPTPLSSQQHPTPLPNPSTASLNQTPALALFQHTWPEDEIYTQTSKALAAFRSYRNGSKIAIAQICKADEENGWGWYLLINRASRTGAWQSYSEILRSYLEEAKATATKHLKQTNPEHPLLPAVLKNIDSIANLPIEGTHYPIGDATKQFTPVKNYQWPQLQDFHINCEMAWYQSCRKTDGPFYPAMIQLNLPTNACRLDIPEERPVVRKGAPILDRTQALRPNFNHYKNRHCLYAMGVVKVKGVRFPYFIYDAYFEKDDPEGYAARYDELSKINEKGYLE